MNMKKFLLVLASLAVSLNPAFATPVKVIKKGGNRAVVEFPKGTQVEVGEILQMSMGEGDEAASSSSPAGRKNFFGLSGGMTYNLDAAPGTSAFSVGTYEIQYGWNLGMFEFAPSVSFSKISSFSWAFKGQVDVNFVENKPGASFVPAFTVDAGVTKGITIPVHAGLVGKLFILGHSQSAIRAGVTFDFTKVSGGSQKKISILTLGVQTYF